MDQFLPSDLRIGGVPNDTVTKYLTFKVEEIRRDMAHCIHAIVAPLATADVIAICWPELPRLDRENGYSIFPVDAELIDAKIAPDRTPTVTDDTFMLMTNGFRHLLQEMSKNGQLAYVETEYFGGVGGQAALVCRNGGEIMPPTWSESGTINDALGLIGMERESFADRFIAAGFGLVRNNDGIRELIQVQSSVNRM